MYKLNTIHLRILFKRINFITKSPRINFSSKIPKESKIEKLKEPNLKNLKFKDDIKEKPISNDDITDLHPLPEPKYSFAIMKKLMQEIEGSIIGDTYKIRSVPASNFFGEILLYISPVSYVKNNLKTNIEFSGLAAISVITFLNYYMLIFPSMYLFNYFVVVSIVSAAKYMWKLKYLQSVIYELSLVNNDLIKITYYNGWSEFILIKNIQLSNKMKDSILLFDETKTRMNKDIVPIEVRLDGRKDAVMMLSNNTKQNFHVELEPLLAILHKNTNYLTV